MTEDQIMQRAREYASRFSEDEETARKIRVGEYDVWSNVTAYAQALRDYDKPQSYFAPVDPDLLIAREICALRRELDNHPGLAKRNRDRDFDSHIEMDITLFAVKHMRKLLGDKS